MIDPLTAVAVVVAGLATTAVSWRLHRRTRVVEAEAAALRRELGAARHAASHDALTGLPNRRAFFQRAGHLLADPSRRSMVAVVVDLDDFKRVNDELGHAAGDQVLATVARRFAALAGDGLVARLGGDELAGLLPGAHADPRLGARLSETLGAPMVVAGHEVQVTVSVGVAVIPPPAPDTGAPFQAALRAADAAMYRAKAGRQRPRQSPSHPQLLDIDQATGLAAPLGPSPPDWSTSAMPVPTIDPYQRDPAAVAPADSYRHADPVWVYRSDGWRAGVVENVSPQAVTVTYRPPGSRGTGVDTLTAPYLLPREDEDPVLDRSGP